jgi:PPM family protein phosphatase
VTNVVCALSTHPGRDPDKQVNEDSAHHADTQHGYLAVVCDGMGGHEGGLEASRAAISAMFEVFGGTPPGAAPAALLKQAIEIANQRVYALGGKAKSHRPGSTIVAILVHPAGCEVGHVGDSRVYLTHAGATMQVTRDHSAVQLMVNAGLLTPAQAQAHPDANIITKALGMSEAVSAEVRTAPVPYVAGDTFLLCSDGLSDLINEVDIDRTLLQNPLDRAASVFVDMANERGGHDNITVLLLTCKESSSQARSLPRTVLDAEPPSRTLVEGSYQPAPRSVPGEGERSTTVDIITDRIQAASPSSTNLSGSGESPAAPRSVTERPRLGEVDAQEKTVVMGPVRPVLRGLAPAHAVAAPHRHQLPPAQAAPPASVSHVAPSAAPTGKMPILLVVLLLLLVTFGLGVGATLLSQKYLQKPSASTETTKNAAPVESPAVLVPVWTSTPSAVGSAPTLPPASEVVLPALTTDHHKRTRPTPTEQAPAIFPTAIPSGLLPNSNHAD